MNSKYKYLNVSASAYDSIRSSGLVNRNVSHDISWRNNGDQRVLTLRSMLGGNYSRQGNCPHQYAASEIECGSCHSPPAAIHVRPESICRPAMLVESLVNLPSPLLHARQHLSNPFRCNGVLGHVRHGTSTPTYLVFCVACQMICHVQTLHDFRAHGAPWHRFRNAEIFAIQASRTAETPSLGELNLLRPNTSLSLFIPTREQIYTDKHGVGIGGEPQCVHRHGHLPTREHQIFSQLFTLLGAKYRRCVYRG